MWTVLKTKDLEEGLGGICTMVDNWIAFLSKHGKDNMTLDVFNDISGNIEIHLEIQRSAEKTVKPQYEHDVLLQHLIRHPICLCYKF